MTQVHVLHDHGIHGHVETVPNAVTESARGFEGAVATVRLARGTS